MNNDDDIFTRLDKMEQDLNKMKQDLLIIRAVKKGLVSFKPTYTIEELIEIYKTENCKLVKMNFFQL